LLIKKNKSRTSKTQKEREKTFTLNLDTLFDIAHADALSMMKINEDKDFLKDRREERKMVMTIVDKDLVKKQARSLKRQAEEEAKKCKAARASCAGTSAVALTIQPNALASLLDDPEENEDVRCDEDSSDEEYTPDKRILVKIKPSSENRNELHETKSKQSLFTPQVTSALDRNKVSDREAVRLMIPVAAALGQDPLALPISRRPNVMRLRHRIYSVPEKLRQDSVIASLVVLKNVKRRRPNAPDKNKSKSAGSQLLFYTQ
jgi:hypothetical protein